MTNLMENRKRNISCKKISSEITGKSNARTPYKDLCPICLDPLSYSSGSGSGQAIFTAQCSHAFHFSCISSNVRYGSVTCPICRGRWMQLPRSLNTGSISKPLQGYPITIFLSVGLWVLGLYIRWNRSHSFTLLQEPIMVIPVPL